jgi:hypothetical protein
MERIHIESLEPWTKSACELLKAHALAEGIPTLVSCGARTAAEQMVEFEKGRKLVNGVWVKTGAEPTSTNATPEHDPHVRRAAFDVYPLTSLGALATMDPKRFAPLECARQLKELWQPLVRIGTALRIEGSTLRLITGSCWPHLHDWPHFEREDWRLLPMPAP